MRWNKFEAVQEMLRETVRVPDTYITVSRMLPKGREVQIGSHPWDDWEDVHRWLKKTARSLDPSPEGVKLRTRIFEKGGKPLRSVVSLVQGRGKGPSPIAAPSATPPAAPQAPSTFHSCPACVATQALLVAKQLQVVDLDARLEHARRGRRDLEDQLASTQAELGEACGVVAELRRRVACLEREQARAIATLERHYAAHGDTA